MIPIARARAVADAARFDLLGDRRRSPRTGQRDRRSAHRPNFVEGWRKSIGAPRPRSQSAATIQDARIDVWLADTEALIKAHSCLTLLTEDDRACLTRLRDPTARYSAMAAKIVLRLALSRAVNRRVGPSEWRFGTTSHDKPVVTGPLSGINFTVSHVDQLTAVAVAPGLNLGIDIESVDQQVGERVIDGFCHVDERRSLHVLPAPQRLREFIRFWTLKEAYSKLVGLGHSLDFDRIKCTVDPLAVRVDGASATQSTQCESFFVTVGHALFHASLAIELPARSDIGAELQIVNLAASQTNVTALATSSCG